MRDVLEFWIQLHSDHEIEISFKFIPKILMSKECIHFLGPLCISILRSLSEDQTPLLGPLQPYPLSAVGSAWKARPSMPIRGVERLDRID
jgi:hypothetical protein